jgi:hypothetical protein
MNPINRRGIIGSKEQYYIIGRNTINMPMKRDDHEALLNELLNPEIEQSRRTEILQQLRVDYGTVISDHESITTLNAKLQTEKDDLVVSNSKLFRQLGITGGNEDTKKKEEEKTFSETITLESLENK